MSHKSYLFLGLAIGALFLFSIFYSYAFTGPPSGCNGGGTCGGAFGTDSSNNLSVGTSTTSASTKLLIVASSTGSGEYAMRVIQPGTGPLLIVRNDGKIGVVTSTPAYELAVQGNIYASGNVTCGGTCGGGNVAAANVTPGTFNNGSPGSYSFAAGLGVATSGTTLPVPGLNVYATSTFLIGNVGIGTSNPAAILHVIGNSLFSGTINASSTITQSGTAVVLQTRNVSTAGGLTGGGALSGDLTISISAPVSVSNGGTNKISYTAGSIVFASSTAILGENNANFFWDNANNRHGIGTAQPSSTLHVVGGTQIVGNTTTTNLTITALAGTGGCLSVTASGAVATSTCSGGSGITSLNGLSGASQTFASSSAAGFNITSSGSVHTFSYPSKIIQIATLSTTTGNILVGDNASGWLALSVGANGKVLTASSTAANGVSWETASASGGSGTVTTSTAVTANYFPFWNSTNGSGLNGTSSIYQSALNIGIGTTQPSSSLHVVGGDLTISGTGAGLAVGTTTGQAAGVIYATGNITTVGSFTGNLSASNVTAGLFGSGSFSFPSSLGIATSGTALPVAGLNVYGTSTFLIGNVGIGTAQPSSTLHVVGTLQIPTNAALTQAGQITVETSSSTLNFYDGTAQQVLSPLKPLPFVFENPTASEDDAVFIFNETSTITKIYAVNKTQGDTVTFNLVWDPNRNLAQASAQHLFSSNQAVTATTTPASSFTLASTTVNAGSVMRFITSAASSTQFTFTLYYKDVP